MRKWLSHDADIDDEVQFHLDRRAESYRRAGMSEEEAMALAEKRFGDVAAMKRAMRGARTHRLYGLAAIAVLALVALWIYDASRPAALPSLPPGMEFVGRPPAVP